MASKSSSQGQKEHYKRYKAENRWEKNKVTRMKRHLSKYPGDEQTADVLNKKSHTYTRNKFLGLKKGKAKSKLKQLPIDSRIGLREQLNVLSK